MMAMLLVKVREKGKPTVLMDFDTERLSDTLYREALAIGIGELISKGRISVKASDIAKDLQAFLAEKYPEATLAEVSAAVAILNSTKVR
jgi:hypothetical protein